MAHRFRVLGPFFRLYIYKFEIVNSACKARDGRPCGIPISKGELFLPQILFFFAPSDNEQNSERLNRTIDSGVVRFNKGLLHLAVLDDQSVAFATLVSEDGGAVESKIESFCEFACWVSQEANLGRDPG